VKEALFDAVAVGRLARAPLVVGKRDARGAPLLQEHGELSPGAIRLALAASLAEVSAPTPAHPTHAGRRAGERAVPM
jgi:hypothetical protein